MAGPVAPITVALLATPDSTASTLYGFFDCLAGTRRDWSLLHGEQPMAASPFRPLLVSRRAETFTAANGVRITADAALTEVPAPQVLCITDLAVPPGEPVAQRYEAELRWVRAAHDAGALVCSACSGAVLLACTGLLDGLDATSHWAYCDALQRAHPRTRWHPERGLVAAGERLLMAGSGVAWHLLVLALISRFAGPQEAMRVARINLMDAGQTTPVAYASLTHGGRAADPLVAHCQAWAAMNYACEAPVARMVALSGLAERTFKRRFTQATGMAPLEYVHTLRLEEAKQMLESGDAPVEAVALEVGYQDAGFFGRLFRRHVGLTPAQYRRRFGALAHRLGELQTAAPAPRPAQSRTLAS
jgi:transcriptional regulator GlxA family with amidase domain